MSDKKKFNIELYFWIVLVIVLGYFGGAFQNHFLGPWFAAMTVQGKEIPVRVGTFRTLHGWGSTVVLMLNNREVVQFKTTSVDRKENGVWITVKDGMNTRLVLRQDPNENHKHVYINVEVSPGKELFLTKAACDDDSLKERFFEERLRLFDWDTLKKRYTPAELKRRKEAMKSREEYLKNKGESEDSIRHDKKLKALREAVNRCAHRIALQHQAVDTWKAIVAQAGEKFPSH